MTHKMHVIATASALALLAGCGGSDKTTLGGGDYEVNIKPSFAGAATTTTYDGTTDDLLTAGVGKTGLLSTSAAPTLSATPTAAELRKLAIVTNYRAIVDTTANGGFGTLYGPNVSVDGVAGSGEGKIAGTETIAYSDDGTGAQNVTMMVQVPGTFDPKAPCIVTATSSGSRGVYGAIGSAGEWGLKHGCAVAYTDKGTGNGVHDVQNNTVNLIDGRRTDATTAGTTSNFTARLTAAERTAFNAATPNRLAVKHAHSEQNPEKDWGKFTLQAVEFAFWVLNEKYGDTLADGRRTKVIKPANTIVIASSVSNGAGAALAAAEQDTAGLIDGVAVSEPNIQLGAMTGTIQRGTQPAYTGGSKPLYDYFTYGTLLQPCAALSAAAVGSPFGAGVLVNVANATNRCAALAANGLVAGATVQAQADDAMAKLQAYGWEPDSNLLHASQWSLASTSIAVTYANTYGRFRVSDNVCGFSFAAADATGVPVATAAASIAGIFSTGNGVPPTGVVQIINNNSVGGPRKHDLSTSVSTNTTDLGFDSVNCLRQLWTGTSANATKVKAGVAEVYRTANLAGKPTIIVHGRNDVLIPTNFSSRPYVLRNQQVEGASSKLRYIEVTNAQHFDSFLPALAGYDTRYIPLHLYFVRAMDAMWAHLKNGTALPPSQVVHTTPRGGTTPAPALTAANVPAINANPGAAERITISGSTLTIPD